jgi:putative membrane protein
VEIVMVDTDLSLAIGHHLLVFMIFGLLFAELVLVRPGMNQIMVARVAKLGTFIAIALISVPPTIAYIRWRRANVAPGDAQVRTMRRYLWIECALFALLPAFAAAMARGYGEFGF